MRSPIIVKVDRNGVDAEGNDTNLIAAAEPVRLGYMVNVPILAEYPDGKLRQGNLMRITPAGLEYFRRVVPLDIRNPEGSA